MVDGMLANYRLDVSYRIAHHGDKFSTAIMNPTVTESRPGVIFDED